MFKNISFITILLIFFSEISSMENNKKEEISELTKNHIVLKIPKPILKRILMHSIEKKPENLFLITMVFYKRFYELLRHEIMATTAIFKKIYYADCNLNSWFSKNHGIYTEKGSLDNREAFKYGFRNIIFNVKEYNDMESIVNPSYKTLKHYLEDSCDFPSSIEKDYPEKYGKTINPFPDNESVLFNWLTIFKLYHAQIEIPSYGLEKYYSFSKEITKEKNFNYLVNKFCELPRKFSKTTIFESMRETYLKLTRLLYIKHEKSKEFFNKIQYEDIRYLQSIPVNFNTLDQDIEDLRLASLSIHEQLLSLADKRFNIIQKICFFLQIG